DDGNNAICVALSNIQPEIVEYLVKSNKCPDNALLQISKKEPVTPLQFAYIACLPTAFIAIFNEMNQRNICIQFTNEKVKEIILRYENIEVYKIFVNYNLDYIL